MPKTNKNINLEPIRTPLYGTLLLNHPALNKGAAFTREERDVFGLEGLLPYEVARLEVQCKRAKTQLDKRNSALQKHSFLASLRDQNQVLFYRFMQDNLKDLLRILYTPGVADATGCFLTLPNQASIKDQLMAAIENLNVTAGASATSAEAREAIEVVVVTDSEAILGIGDQGVGGITIATSKAALYTIGAGMDPNRILPVVLDVGTDNHVLLSDPLYMGWRHNRVRGKRYDDFVAVFVDAVRDLFPNAILHFEDFGTKNANKLLADYKHGMPVFNDDIQGTGAVTLAALVAAVGVASDNKGKLSDQRIVIYGAGSAGIGIADAIRDGMVAVDGITKEEAQRRFWCIDREGLIVQSMGDKIHSIQQPYARPDEDVAGWKLQREGGVYLFDVVRHVKPTVLIGTSTHAGAFNEEVVREMAKHAKRPIIFPLSNPNRLVEVAPEDALTWTDGKALVSTGSPFAPVELNGTTYVISETNNALYYPALGLGAALVRAKTISDMMILAGVEALAGLSPAAKDATKPLLPDLHSVREVSVHIAAAVIRQAVEDENVREDEATADVRAAAQGKKGELESLIKSRMWEAVYRPLEFVQADVVPGQTGKRRRLV